MTQANKMTEEMLLKSEISDINSCPLDLMINMNPFLINIRLQEKNNDEQS